MGARWWVVVVVVCLAVAARAQPKPPKEPPSTQLKPTAWSGLPNGKIITLKGETTPTGDRFALERLSVLQPVTVAVVAEHVGDPIEVVLAKDRWDEKIRSGVTGPDGKLVMQLRTESELRIIVRSAGDPKPYGLMVWVGDDVVPTFAPVITPMKSYRQRHPQAGSSAATVVIAVSLVAIVILLAVIAFRKRGRR